MFNFIVLYNTCISRNNKVLSNENNGINNTTIYHTRFQEIYLKTYMSNRTHYTEKEQTQKGKPRNGSYFF